MQLKEAKEMAPVVEMHLRKLIEQEILQHASLAAALIDARGDILYLHGRTGRYLESASGEVGRDNVLTMARTGLHDGLTEALGRSLASSEVQRCVGLLVKSNDSDSLLDVTVIPISTTQSGFDPRQDVSKLPLFLVLFENIGSVKVDTSAAQSGISDQSQQLKSGGYLLHAPPVREVSADSAVSSQVNAELKNSNVKLTNSNENLISINEIMLASKEELESINEELSVMNSELQEKVSQLAQLNSDMNSLLASSDIGTLFVDLKLRVLRFAPLAGRVCNLIRGDVGRPLAHINTNLVSYHTLISDIHSVLNTLAIKEHTVQTGGGDWYTMRIQPYRNLENLIEGAVISFVDISQAVHEQDAREKVNQVERLVAVLRDANDAFVLQASDGRTLAWNLAATKLYGWSEKEALLLNVSDRSAKKSTSKPTEITPPVDESYLSTRRRKDGSVVDVMITSTVLRDKAGEVFAVATIERTLDITPQEKNSSSVNKI